MTARALLGDLVKVVGGGTPTRNNPEFYGGGIPWVTPKDMKSWTISGSQVSLTQAGLTKSPARLVPSDSVLVVVRSGVLKHTIPVALNSVPVALNQDMKALICSGAVLPAFLARYVKWKSPEILQWVRATTADNFPIDKLKNLEIPVPSLVEQRRIAAILDHADALRAKRSEALAHLDDLTQSIFLDMFGDPESERSEWPVEPLEAVVATTSGGTPSRTDRGNFGGLIPWVKSGELHRGMVMRTEESITEKGLANSSAKLMPPGTVLLAMYGATVGAVAILGIEAATNQAICCIQPGPKVDRTYLVHRLKEMTPALLAQRAGGAQPNLSQGIVRALRIPVPPMAVQKNFSDRVSQIDMLKTVQSAQLMQLENLFSSAQSRAFAGEL